jgi:hypothetical protein
MDKHIRQNQEKIVIKSEIKIQPPSTCPCQVTRHGWSGTILNPLLKFLTIIYPSTVYIRHWHWQCKHEKLLKECAKIAAKKVSDHIDLDILALTKEGV